MKKILYCINFVVIFFIISSMSFAQNINLLQGTSWKIKYIFDNGLYINKNVYFNNDFFIDSNNINLTCIDNNGYTGIIHNNSNDDKNDYICVFDGSDICSDTYYFSIKDDIILGHGIRYYKSSLYPPSLEYSIIGYKILSQEISSNLDNVKNQYGCFIKLISSDIQYHAFKF